MARIKIVGLGPGAWTSLPIGTYKILQENKKKFVRTDTHPLVKDLREKGIQFESFDELYEQADKFDSLHKEIVDKLLKEAEKFGEVVYAVPGHPLIGEPTVLLAKEKGAEVGIEVEIGPGHSFIEETLTKLKLSPVNGMLLLDGKHLEAKQINPSLHTVIFHVHNRLVASEVKIKLMEQYADDYPVTVIRAAGIEGEEKIVQIPLYQLDHLDWLDPLTTIYLNPTEDPRVKHRQFSTLVEIVNTLRAPNGCPWDREQTHKSIRKNVIEEAYEVAEAIDLGDPEALSEELGDLLLQVALHSQMASEEGTFTIHDTIQAINDKLIRRHPHVFGDLAAGNAETAEANWDEIKKQEKREKGLPEQISILETVSNALPAITVAEKLQSKAAKVGFEWDDVSGVYDKLAEEIEELRMTEDKSEELGDVLFVLVNLARYLKVDPEESLAKTNEKFRRRFGYIEKKLSEQGKTFAETTLNEMDLWWNEAKSVEKK